MTEEKKEDQSLVDAIVAWVMQEIKESGLLLWESVSDQQLERIKETVIAIVTLIIMAAYDKENRVALLKDIQGALNSLNADAALATIKAQDAVKGAFQNVAFKIGGGIFN